MITEKKIAGFNNTLNYTKLNYPQCSCGACPQFYWNMLSCAPRASGKTYTICQLIRHWEENKIVKNGVEYKLRTILISPTIQANEIYTSLKSLDFEKDTYHDYADGIILDIVEDVKQRKKDYEEWLEYVEYYKRFIKIPDNKLEQAYDKFPGMFKKLEEHDYEHYNIIPHKDPEVVVVLLDDLLGTGSFSTKHRSALTNALIKNRHIGLCFCILSQSLKAVPKNIRLNCNLFFLGCFKSKKVILEDIYEEVSNVCTIDEFEAIYDHATKEQYGALVIDLTHKEKRFLKGFETELVLDSLDNN